MTATVTAVTTPAIAVTGLRKSYGDLVVLDGIDLTVPAGTVVQSQLYLRRDTVGGIGATD